MQQYYLKLVESLGSVMKSFIITPTINFSET